MDVARGKTRVGRLPAGLLGMVALVATAERFVDRHGPDTLPGEVWQYSLARHESARQARGRDLLCLGDSLVKVSVLPDVVEARSGLRAYNLAVVGGQAPASEAVLRRALAGGSRPSAVLVDFFPPLLARGPGLGVHQLPHLLGCREALELGLRARDPALLGRLVAGRLLPSVRSRDGLRSWAVDAASGGPSRRRAENVGYLRHWARHAGAMVMPCAPDRRVDVATYQRYQYPARWAPDRVNADYVRRFLALAASHGVTVYWLLPPIHPQVQAAAERAGFDARYTAFVRKCQAQYPGLVVIDGRHAGYDPAVFMDADHLGRDGAYALSVDLGDLLRRLRRETPPGRWAALPPYRPRPVGPGIEPFNVMTAQAPATALR